MRGSRQPSHSETGRQDIDFLSADCIHDAMRYVVFVGTEVYWLSLGIIAGLVLAWPLSLIRIRNQPIIQLGKEQ